MPQGKDVPRVRFRDKTLAPAGLRGRIERAESIARVDDLTEVANRRSLVEQGTKIISRMRREEEYKGLTLGAVLIDVDGFKQINDTLGHVTGDSILKNVARALVSEVREGDVVARFGGDEFVLLLPIKNEDELRKIVYESRTSQDGSEAPGLITSAEASMSSIGVNVGLSAGVAVLSRLEMSVFSNSETAFNDLLERADQSMYGVKRRRKGN